MRKMIIALLLTVAAPAAAVAQTERAAGPWDPGARLAAQREAMKALAFMDGEWRGPAKWESYDMTQTERVGTLLDGTVRLVEGRGYDAQGKTVFNAFAVISYDPVTRRYSMQSHAAGYTGSFPLDVHKDGWSWSQPMGPGTSIKYTATFTADGWREVGERVSAGAAPAKAFEMTLKRVQPSSWPVGIPVPAR